MDYDCLGWALLYLDLLLVMTCFLLAGPGGPEVSLGQALGPVLPTTVTQGLASCPRLSVCSVHICCMYESTRKGKGWILGSGRAGFSVLASL